MKTFKLVLIIILLSQIAYSQDSTEKMLIIDFLNIKKAKNNFQQDSISKIFENNLLKFLNQKNSYTYEFDSLSKYISILNDEDNQIKIITWNIENFDEVNKFFGFVITQKRVFLLNDNHNNIEKPETANLNDNNWYGAVYYKLVQTKKNEYTLLGWNGRDRFSSEKIIEHISIGKNKMTFDKKIFVIEKKTQNRIILRFANDAYVSLKYSEENKKKETIKTIIFSHLSTISKHLTNSYSYYYPDGSYDFIKLVNGKWIYTAIADARNEYDRKYEREYKDNRK